MSEERWLPIPGYEGHYEVSDHGRVRSLDRLIYKSNPTRWTRSRGRILKQTPHPRGRLQVSLCLNGHRYEAKVHQLVLLAFVGPRPDGMEVCHWDDDGTNNHLSNLRYGTQSENMHDRVRNGLEPHANQTHCLNGHEFTAENTYRRPGYKWRQCRTCRSEQSRVRNLMRRAS